MQKTQATVGFVAQLSQSPTKAKTYRWITIIPRRPRDNYPKSWSAVTSSIPSSSSRGWGEDGTDWNVALSFYLIRVKHRIYQLYFQVVIIPLLIFNGPFNHRPEPPDRDSIAGHGGMSYGKEKWKVVILNGIAQCPSFYFLFHCGDPPDWMQSLWNSFLCSGWKCSLLILIPHEKRSW